VLVSASRPTGFAENNLGWSRRDESSRWRDTIASTRDACASQTCARPRKSLRAFFEGSGFTAQVRKDFAREVQ